jgi:hypothetical protein
MSVADGAPDRRRRAELITPFVEFVAEDGCREDASTKPATSD